MPTAILTSEGQITIPVEVRKGLNVDAGDQVHFSQVAPGLYEVVAATHNVSELKGMFGKPSRKVSIDDMNQAIAQALRSAVNLGIADIQAGRFTTFDSAEKFRAHLESVTTGAKSKT